MTPEEILERQNEIIRIQSDSISELFNLLMLHISTEEVEILKDKYTGCRGSYLGDLGNGGLGGNNV